MTVTLATVITEFLSRPDLAKSTKRTYELALKPILLEYGSWAIEIIGKQTLIEYLKSLSGCNYTTHRKYQAILQSLFNFAVEQGYIKFNPIRGLKQRQPNPEKGEHKSDSVIRYLRGHRAKTGKLYAKAESFIHQGFERYLFSLTRKGRKLSKLVACFKFQT
ncbi:recombinase XerD [Anabaena sp. UHCC 0253]|uniref:phage integrase N-terminal SAM-like domain-containing protein n=1 Tax=Anabaena sp. UHCC 0253 TaxID=2590019 RepID=UPI0014456E51|nr:phage integrase N-terminal SAM-like domain-containing protein [Anabaena sp. UHCC 0253]MTJ55963.1 recombinase XerD [Anabaena sp. UHCC 0253]